MATDNFWGKFARWRRHRPFWGGLILIVAALELFFSGNLSVGGIEIHLGPQGFLSYLLPLLLLVSAVLCWFSPAQRLFYGIIALLAALYSFVGLNLGGFFFGMLLGIVGGGLVIAWGPPRDRPGAELQDGPPGGEPNDADPDGGDDTPPADPDAATTQIIEVAGHDDRPHEQPVRPAFVPGFEEQPPKQGNAMRSLGKSQKALVIAVIPLAITATILVIGSTLPASAETCPAGLTPLTSATSEAATTAKTAAAAKTTKTTAAAAKPKSKASASASASSDSSSGGSDTTIIDGIEQFIDGVGNLLGVTDETSSPSESPSPSESASASASSSPSASASASSSPSESAPASASASGSASATATASPSSTASAIPCLGDRAFGLTASADDVPLVAQKQAVMKISTLTMEHMKYEGVVHLKTTGGGTVEALKFSMNKATNASFGLTINEPKGTTTITSDKLVTSTVCADGKDSCPSVKNVKFYATKFEGWLGGFIPVTFTPDLPPPDLPDLGIPLVFTGVTIQLAYVRSDNLTGDPLKIVAKS